MRHKKIGTLFFVPDGRASRERVNLLNRVLNTARHFADLQILSSTTTEEDLLKRLQDKAPQLVLVPWYLYLKWNKVEGIYGSTRTSGPAFAGYFCEPLDPSMLNHSTDFLRLILLDFCNSTPAESMLLIRCLMEETRRSGVRPLADRDSTVYCESWYPGTRLGPRVDALMNLPEVVNGIWSKRTGALRILYSAIWSLIFEEGPGKTDFAQMSAAQTPRAYFQLAISQKSAYFRLFYNQAGTSSRELLRNFWPHNTDPSSPASLLRRYSDFLRLHWITETNDIEIVAGLWESSVAEKAPLQMHTFWVEPLATQLILEPPFEVPSPTSRQLKAFPASSLANTPLSGPPDSQSQAASESKPKESVVLEAAAKILELKKMVRERDELIQELRSGGVGTAPQLPPPDMEAILEAFQEKYFEARYQIRQFEHEIRELEKKHPNGPTPDEVHLLRARMNALMLREQGWIKQLATILENCREAKKA